MSDNELKLDRFLGDCSGFLEALDSGSMSRNNMENLASELISDLDAVIVERSTRPQDTESNSAEWVAVGEVEKAGWYWVLVNTKIHKNSMYLARFNYGEWDKVQGYDAELDKLAPFITHYHPHSPTPPAEDK